MSGRLFCLISHVPAVHPGDLYEMKFALELNAKACAEAWGYEPPAIEVMENEQNLPDGCCPVAIVDDQTDLSALAYHYWDDVRLLPAARAFWSVASGLRDGSDSLCEAIAHEINEAGPDAHCDRWEDMPGRPGVEVALEDCDPVQSSYYIIINGTLWPVANFVTPAWFRGGDGPYDAKGELSRPGQVGTEGYLILRDETHVWHEGPDGQVFESKKPGALHRLSRSARRIRSGLERGLIHRKKP